MALLSHDTTHDILKQIAFADSLDAILDLLGKRILALGLTDGYVINLLDARASTLITLKANFPREFRNLEQTAIGHKVSLTDNYLNAKVFRQKQIHRIDLARASEQEKVVLQYWRVEEMVGIPILNPDRPSDDPIGVVVLMKRHGSIVIEEIGPLQEVLSLLYRGLRNWLRHAHLEQMHQRAQAAVAENTRLLQFLDEMNSLTSVDMIYDMFAAELFRQLGFDLAAFFLAETDKLAVKKVVAAHPRFDAVARNWRDYLEQHPYPLDASVSGGVYVLFKDEPIHIPDVHAVKHLPMTPHDAKSVAILATPRTFFVSPIRHQKKPIGIFALYSLTQPVTLTDADIHLLQQLSSFFGTAIANGKAYALIQAQNLEIGHLNLMLQEKVKELAEQASTDRLTGLLNFRTFEQEMGKRVKECQRASGKKELSLALIDIDHFKQFNDTYGHAAGNDILAGVANEIRKLIRETDMAFRYGGEEFVLLLPKCDLEGAQLLAERLRTVVETHAFASSAGLQKVTVSIGCTMYQQGDNKDRLFARADEALYRAKQLGRNLVCSS